MLKKGVIVSIQGYHYKTISELAKEAINAGCIGLRVDKKLMLGDCEPCHIIGLHKIPVSDPKRDAFITPNIDTIKKIEEWADYVSVDYRRCNPNLKDISDYARYKKLKIIADIECIEDYENIKAKDLFYSYIATTFTVYRILFHPNLKLVDKLFKLGEKNIIAEGNYSTRKDVRAAFESGAHCVCIGGAISNVYKLTKKFTSVDTNAK